MSSSEEYININASSVGYVKNIKCEIVDGKDVVKIKMNLLSGKKSDMNYIPAELFVSGAQALGVAIGLHERIESVGGKYDKILLSFIGRVTPSYYISKSKNGQIIPIFNGSVSYINGIKENGISTYSAKILRDILKNNEGTKYLKES